MRNNTKYKSNIQYSFLKALRCGGVLLFTTACSNYYKADMNDQSDINSQSGPIKLSKRRAAIDSQSGPIKLSKFDCQENIQKLQLAVKNNQAQEVKILLTEYSHLEHYLIEQSNSTQESLLMEAVRNGNLDMAKLLKKGSIINYLNDCYETVLHIAIDEFKENFEMIDWILDQEEFTLNELNDDNYSENRKLSPRLLFGMMLEKASLSSRPTIAIHWLERIRKLMDIKGFNINSYDEQGNAAIHLLVEYSNQIIECIGMKGQQIVRKQGIFIRHLLKR